MIHDFILTVITTYTVYYQFFKISPSVFNARTNNREILLCRDRMVIRLELLDDALNQLLRGEAGFSMVQCEECSGKLNRHCSRSTWWQLNGLGRVRWNRNGGPLNRNGGDSSQVPDPLVR